MALRAAAAAAQRKIYFEIPPQSQVIVKNISNTLIHRSHIIENVQNDLIKVWCIKKKKSFSVIRRTHQAY